MKFKNQIKPIHNLPPIQYQNVQDVTERDAIPANRRYLGMSCYVIEEDTSYRLVGGLTNPDWAAVGGGAGFTTTFVDADLSGGVIVFDHNLVAENQVTHVTIKDDTNYQIAPDSIRDVSANSTRVDLSMLQPLIGTWTVIITCVVEKATPTPPVAPERFVNSRALNKLTLN